MDDLITRFRELDGLAVPDLREEARRRLPETAPPVDPAPRRAPSERVVAMLVAFLVFGAAAALGLRALRDDAVAPQPADAPWSWVAEGWTELPPPPQWRDSAAIVWTGSELLSWGGRAGGGQPPASDGFAFDPVTRAWTAIPSAPGALGAPSAVWTGEEAVFFELDEGKGSGSMFAFDPDARGWRKLSPPPHEPAWGGAWAWTGTELVVAGGGDVGDPETYQAWALDPRRDAWRPLPEMPIAVNLADATWTGHEFVVLGSEIDRRNHASTRTAVAAAYDPVGNSWRLLPDPPVSAQTSAVDTVSGRLVAWEGYSPASAEYLPDEVVGDRSTWEGSRAASVTRKAPSSGRTSPPGVAGDPPPGRPTLPPGCTSSRRCSPTPRGSRTARDRRSARGKSRSLPRSRRSPLGATSGSTTPRRHATYGRGDLRAISNRRPRPLSAPRTSSGYSWPTRFPVGSRSSPARRLRKSSRSWSGGAMAFRR